MSNNSWSDLMGIRERAFAVWVVLSAGKDMESAKLYGYDPVKDLIKSPAGIIRRVGFEAAESLKRCSVILTERGKKTHPDEVAKFCEKI